MLGAGLLLVLTFLVGAFASHAPAEAGGGCHAALSATQTDARGTHVDIGKCAFSPTVIRVDPGAAVQWVNQDGVPHMVTGVGRSWGDPRQYKLGDSVTFNFTQAGVYPYFCELHPGMVGAVVVGDGVSANGSVLDISAIGSASGEGQASKLAPTQQEGDGLGTTPAALIALASATAGIVATALVLALARRRRSGL